MEQLVNLILHQATTGAAVLDILASLKETLVKVRLSQGRRGLFGGGTGFCGETLESLVLQEFVSWRVVVVHGK